MQNHAFKSDFLSRTLPSSGVNPLLKDALGISCPYNAQFGDASLEISQQQIEILEDAIRRYERLEDIKKFSALVLEDIDNVTEEDIKRAVELENTVSIEDEKAVLGLIQNEGFLRDLESADFSAYLNMNSTEKPSKSYVSALDEDDNEDFSDFDI